MIIQYDDREGKNVELMMALIDKDSDVKMIRERLDIGDYICGDVCVERKEVNDFCGSILDKRLESQVKRMKGKFDNVYVIVVGHIKDRTSEIHENCILGMISKLVVDYQVSVLMVDDEWQFLYLLKRIFERHLERNSKDMIKEVIEDEK